jgi:ketosteroid isomerase-like protein
MRRLMARLNAGDPQPILRTFAPDAHLVFPGGSSFAGDHRGKQEIEAWFTRFVALRPQFTIHDVTVAGPPWNTRVAVRFEDRIPMPDGDGEYENEGVIYLRMRWGRVREDRTYLDTEKVAEFDARLDRQAAPAAANR